MSEVGRAFLAVSPPADVTDAVDARLESARGAVPDLRWIASSDWHVTVRFLGRVADVEDVVARVGTAVAGVPPVQGLRLVGAGAFPKPRHGSVLWVGVEDGAACGALRGLAATVEAACVDAGFAPDDRGFDPHVTVARARRARDLRPVVAAIGPGPVGDPWAVTEIRLVASDTRPEGAVYTEVARLPLGV